MKRHLFGALAAVFLVIGSSPLAAQDSVRPLRTNKPGAPGRPIEQQLQRRVNMIVRRQLQLNDDQMTKLENLNARLEGDRLAIRNEERLVRSSLRAELLSGAAANEQKIADLLDRLPQIERKRIGLMEQEQKELAQFLTPSQRARYFALQDELRRNLQDLQRRRMGGEPGPDDPGAPGRGMGRGMRRPPPPLVP